MENKNTPHSARAHRNCYAEQKSSERGGKKCKRSGKMCGDRPAIEAIFQPLGMPFSSKFKTKNIAFRTLERSENLRLLSDRDKFSAKRLAARSDRSMCTAKERSRKKHRPNTNFVRRLYAVFSLLLLLSSVMGSIVNDQ